MSNSNSSDGWAIVLAAVITVGGMVFTQLFNWIQNWFQRKADFQEKLYFEGLQRRFAIYEDVLNTLSRMRTNEELPWNISLNDLKVKFSDYTHTLDTLIVRLSLFGSPASVEILRSFRDRIYDALVIDGDVATVTYARDVRAGLMGFIWKALSEFTECVRTEAPIKIVDEFIHHSGSGVKILNKHEQTDHSARKDNKHKKQNNY
jgi:hypothetical protein